MGMTYVRALRLLPSFGRQGPGDMRIIEDDSSAKNFSTITQHHDHEFDSPRSTRRKTHSSATHTSTRQTPR
jgi:hypothetical protein